MKNGVEEYPSISVIIPTLNAEKWLDSLLSMLACQTILPSEILIIDSDSTDSTRRIARQYNARVKKISREQFDHGGTRTMAAAMTESDIIVYMTQDAIPVNEHVLERLVNSLWNNELVAAAYGRQLASADANFFSKYLRQVNYPESSYVRCWQDRHIFGFRTIFISNSFAAYRREVLAAHGFFAQRLLFGEDTLAVANLLENGYCVAYVSNACVYHSHNYSIVQDIRRYFDIGVFHSEHKDQLGRFGGPGNEGRKYVFSELATLMNNKRYSLIPESLLRNFGKFIAYYLGKRYRWLPRCCARNLSMNRDWWI